MNQARPKTFAECTFEVNKTKLMKGDVTYVFKKVTAKGYQFIDKDGNRLNKDLYYRLKPRNGQTLIFDENTVTTLLPVMIANILTSSIFDYERMVNKQNENEH